MGAAHSAPARSSATHSAGSPAQMWASAPDFLPAYRWWSVLTAVSSCPGPRIDCMEVGMERQIEVSFSYFAASRPDLPDLVNRLHGSASQKLLSALDEDAICPDLETFWLQHHNELTALLQVDHQL